MKKLACFVFLALLASTALLAQADIPLRNWTVPPYAASSSGGIHTMTDATPPRAFIGLPPCRLLDTRSAIYPLGGGGAYAANEIRSYTLWGFCGIPSGTDAVSLNITVTNTGAHPFGFIKIWPQGGTEPNVSTLNWATGGVTVANAAIVPLSGAGGISVRSGNATSDVIIDVNGYFSETLGTPNNFFEIDNNSTGYTAFFTNASTTCGGACGVYAATGSGIAVYGTSANAQGVYGASTATVGAVYGVYGSAVSSNVQAAGVYGTASNAAANGGHFTNSGYASSDTYLATQVSGVNYGIYAFNSRLLGASLTISPGPKNFAAPHPEDAGLEIQYASVEAPTVDVYFRGTAELANGIGRIDVPDHFRFTAREGTYMTTLTPVGRSIALSVESEGPEGIVVRGTGNARFHYVVYAERAEIEGFQPVIKNELFTPEALAKGDRVDSLPATTRALLVRNGTLNPDGSFNVETARAQGWTIPERPQPPAVQTPTP